MLYNIIFTVPGEGIGVIGSAEKKRAVMNGIPIPVKCKYFSKILLIYDLNRRIGFGFVIFLTGRNIYFYFGNSFGFNQ